MALILTIEDNAQHARLVAKLLTKAGHAVVNARNAMDGLTLVTRDRPDIILLDIDLPDLDGKTVANRLRRIPHLRRVPIVACSANTSPAAQRLAIAYGCDGFIPKPIDVRGFTQTVEKYLAASQHLKQAEQADETMTA